MATFEACSVQRGDNSFDDMTSFEACIADEGRAFFQGEGFLIGDIVAFLRNSIPSLNKIRVILLSEILGEPKNCLCSWEGGFFFSKFKFSRKDQAGECYKELAYQV